MPGKKNSSKRPETRYTSIPSKSKSAKPKEVVAKPVDEAKPADEPATSPAAPLIAALRHSDADIARDAATALGSLADAAAVEPLIQVIHNAENYYHPVVRAAAASSLGQLRDRRAVEPLIRAVNDSLAEPSAEAIRALAVIGDPRAVSPLIDVIRNPAGFFLPIARRAAVTALAGFPTDQRAAAELLRVSTDPWEDPVIRQSAADAIKASENNRTGK
jgi:HEAT repeat protein